MFDHPVITRVMLTGYPEDVKEYYCPVCGEELGAEEKVYKAGGEIIGCCHCIDVEDAGEAL